MYGPGQEVANAQQLQQGPVAPTHAGVVSGMSAAQHRSQHSHSQQTGVSVVAPQPQDISRQEQQGQDASLVSISPIPLDHYETPRTEESHSSPPIQPPIEKFAEKETTDENEPSKDGAVSEEIIYPEVTELTRQIDVEEISDSVQESEVLADSELSGSVKQDEVVKDDEMEINFMEVKLHKAENAWKPNALKRSESDQQADEEAIAVESIVKKTRGILNRLTLDNFEKLVSKFMELPLEDNDELISNVIRVVFEKAIDEESYSFSTAYVKMLHKICKTSQVTSKKVRKQILDQCQKEFQKNNADEADIKEVEKKLVEATDDKTRKQLKLDLEEIRFTNRKRSLGNVRLIGELYKLQMLTPKIMVECVHLLLNAPDDEKLECLCKLWTIIGQTLDIQLKSLEDAAKSKPNRSYKPFVPEQKWMTRIFNQLKDLSEDKKFSWRVRFATLDVMELRENDWKPRSDINSPKIIQEVRYNADLLYWFPR